MSSLPGSGKPMSRRVREISVAAQNERSAKRNEPVAFTGPCSSSDELIYGS